MPKTVTILRAFLASPSDLSEERDLLKEVVDELNRSLCPPLGLRLELVKWETHAYPGIGTDPQAVINEQINDDYDIFIGIMWTRFGTPTGRAGSGTEEEFNRAYERYKAQPQSVRVMFYFKDTPPKALSSLDPDQLARIGQFRQKLGEKGTLHWTYDGKEDFAQSLRIHLSRQIQDWKAKMEGSCGPSEDSATPSLRNVDSGSSTPSFPEEEGFIELLEQSVESIQSVQPAVERMAKTLNRLSEKVVARTAEMKGIGSVSGSPQLKAAKRIANAVARDMEQFSKRMKIDGPLFTRSLELGVGFFSRAATMLSDFRQDDLSQVVTTIANIRGLRSVMMESSGKIAGFRGVIAGLPRLTTAINRAKRITVDVLDDLSRGIEKGIERMDEAEKILMGLIPKELGDGAAPT